MKEFPYIEFEIHINVIDVTNLPSKHNKLQDPRYVFYACHEEKIEKAISRQRCDRQG